MQNKLAAWKAKNLSFAGRVTLAKSVMEAIPIYPMMTTNIPQSVLHEIQRLQRSFIWGDSSEGRKYHAVKWHVITQPKNLGGLGLRRMDVMNKACLMKLSWELNYGKNALWSEVLLGKYGRGVTDMLKVIVKPSDSSLWKNLVTLMPNIEANSFKAIGNGLNTYAWEEPWIDAGLRIVDLDLDIPAHIRGIKVASLVDAQGHWNWNLLSWLPIDVSNKLLAIPPPEAANGDDSSFWPRGKHGMFSVASAYDILAEIETEQPAEDNMIWNTIWRIEACERVRFFLWLLNHGRLLTRYRKSKMKLGSPFCTFCGDEIETELHALRDCSKSMVVWLNVVHDRSRELFFNTDLHNWIKVNIAGDI
jgi:hypothetical protein